MRFLAGTNQTVVVVHGKNDDVKTGVHDVHDVKNKLEDNVAIRKVSGGWKIDNVSKIFKNRKEAEGRLKGIKTKRKLNRGDKRK